MMILNKIPGFRTNKKWKKIVSSIVYIIFLSFFRYLLMEGLSECITLKDKVISIVDTVATIFCFFGVPYFILTDCLGLSKRLKHFKNRPILFRIVFLPTVWVISIITIVGIALPVTEKSYSDEYLAILTEERAKRAEEEKIAKAQKEEERLAKAQKEEEERLAKAQKEEEEKLAKAQKEEEEKLAKAQKEEERLAKAQKEEEERLAKAQKEEEEKLAKAQKEEEKLAQANQEKESVQVSTQVEDKTTTNSFNAKKFKKELKKLLKDNKLEESIALINTTQYEESGSIVEEQLEAFVKKIIKSKRKGLLKEKDMQQAQQIIDQLSPIHKLNNLEKYRCVNIVKTLEEWVAYSKAADRLKEEIGDFNVRISPVNLEEIEVLDIYVHHRIQDSSDLVNVLQDLADRVDSSRSQKYYYFTGYDNWFGTAVSNDNFEGVITPKETEFTKSDNYTIQAIQQGTMTLISSDGFERKVPKYREVSTEEITRAYEYDEMKEKYDRMLEYEDKKTSALETIENFIK